MYTDTRPASAIAELEVAESVFYDWAATHTLLQWSIQGIETHIDIYLPTPQVHVQHSRPDWKQEDS